MTNYKVILSLDPSGNFKEGKGTTGWCLFDCKNMCILESGTISSKDYECAEAYWDAHINLIIHYMHAFFKKCAIIMEDYLLYADKAISQTHSYLETPRLIGTIQWFCYISKFPLYFQKAADVKTRWTNDILEFKGIIKPLGKSYTCGTGRLSRHTLDAIRHAVHYSTFKNEVEE